MQDSIDMKESKSNGDGEVWASSHSRLKPIPQKSKGTGSSKTSLRVYPVFSKEHTHMFIDYTIDVKESKSN
eukprot:1589256-Ditylum_brightwellii.AAC.1